LGIGGSTLTDFLMVSTACHAERPPARHRAGPTLAAAPRAAYPLAAQTIQSRQRFVELVAPRLQPIDVALGGSAAGDVRDLDHWGGQVSPRVEEVVLIRRSTLRNCSPGFPIAIATADCGIGLVAVCIRREPCVILETR